jgi:hypothetical protein
MYREDFEKAFLINLRDEKNLAILFKELVALNIENKENVKDFKKKFTTILNNIMVESTPPETMTIQYYTSALHPSIGMFVKQVGKVTLAKTFEESKEFEKDILSLGSHPTTKET